MVSLLAPQKDLQWFSEELRIRGALDHLANMGKELKDSKLVWGQQQIMLLEIVEIEEEGEWVKVR